ncbi:TetR family transcriptional regulator [Novosphingobium bradum]|uniref:TetR family transcriptional regulator n=1 Tax=Novosphingobium bradum TaxID=1737444 RepID=A0ABV7IMJ3_9SPHN
MPSRRRLSHEESRSAALAAARDLLIDGGPQAVTLKAVASRVGRTHANLLHHFGSAGGLQRALVAEMGAGICDTIAAAVAARRAGEGSRRDVVDLVFDAFGSQGGGALASWMLVTGNRDALDPVVGAIHALVDRLHPEDGAAVRATVLTLVLLALGDALMGEPLSRSLGLPADAARGEAVRIVAEAMRAVDAAAGWEGAPD